MNASIHEGKKEGIKLANRSGLILCLPSLLKMTSGFFNFKKAHRTQESGLQLSTPAGETVGFQKEETEGKSTGEGLELVAVREEEQPKNCV